MSNRWSFRRKSAIASHIRHFFRLRAPTWACRRHEVLCVGDDLENDVRGAIRAGLCRACLLDRGADRPADLPHVPNLTALIERKFG